MGWLIGDETDLDEVRSYWPTVDEVDLDQLERLLASARDQCEAFAPALAEGTEVPSRYRHAQALQARALFRAVRAGDNDGVGLDGMGVTVFPMDWTVKNLLRPRRGMPVVR